MAGKLELWGGIECSVNRIGDRYYDQVERSGHHTRPEDLDLIAGLGVRTLRYPVLWERVAPRADSLEGADWSWHDERLGRLRELGIRPIVGLLHHGNGPRGTDLLDPQFAGKFAAYARQVAMRYPWVTHYTPVNEPLTTARFCGLYGHWYPHGHDNGTFARILVQQCRATAHAMAAIREVNPAAQLVQNEDPGKTYSTPELAYQADFENVRRWATWDLLCGRVVSGHALHDFLRRQGVPDTELDALAERPCPPDILGIDHYLTSDRFLDHRLDHYPPWTHGGNGQDRYADVEAVRVCASGVDGLDGLLREAWERYHIPLALTEVHLGCTEDEQMRWLWEVWQTARAVRRRGVDVRAVTAWALLGLYDWDTLLTRCDGHYEPGALDLCQTPPRRTGLADLIEALAEGRGYDHPHLTTPGWWRRPERLLYPAVHLQAPVLVRSRDFSRS